MNSIGSNVCMCLLFVCLRLSDIRLGCSMYVGAITGGMLWHTKFNWGPNINVHSYEFNWYIFRSANTI